MSLQFEQVLTPMASALCTASRDVISGASMLWRGTTGLAGIATLLAGLALVASEEVREQTLAVALTVAGIGDRPAEEPARVEPPSPAARFGNWMTLGPAADPRQEQVTRFLSRRYKVAESAVRQIVGEAFLTGRSLGLDPLLILAVTAVESSLNPFAQSSMGAQGLMQVMTRMHSDKFADHGGDHAALDPIANLKVGSTILRDLIRQGGSIERGLQLYVGAGNLADDGGYAAKVLAELARIKSAAADGRDALAGLRSNRNGDERPEALMQPVGGSARPATPAADRRAT